MGFANLGGGLQATGLLRRSLASGRLAHGLLFEGEESSILEGMALTLAKTLNCQSAQARSRSPEPGPDSCDECASCRRIDYGQHTDIHWIRPESKSRIITIGQMREAMKTINLKPAEGTVKCTIIAAAERMNSQAANAFLKTLEEPPSSSIIMLLSTQPERLLDTIRSRCLRIRVAGEGLPALDSEDQAWLASFAATVSGKGDGLLGRYRLIGSLLERLGKLKQATEKRLEKASPLERYPDADPATRDKWEDELQASVESEYRRLRSQLFLHLEWWLRDLWILCLRDNCSTLRFPEFESATRVVASQITPEEASENLTLIEKLNRQLSSNVQEALAIEVAFLQLKL